MKTLFQETLDLVRNSDQSIPVICKAAGVKPRWLYRVINGDYEDPGVNKIERVYKYLKKGKQ